MSDCKTCVWYKSRNTLFFCINYNDDSIVNYAICPNYFPRDSVDLSNIESKKIFCPRCKKEKDLGKCWWCGCED